MNEHKSKFLDFQAVGDENLLTGKEVTDYLNITLGRLNRMVAAGRIHVAGKRMIRPRGAPIRVFYKYECDKIAREPNGDNKVDEVYRIFPGNIERSSFLSCFFTVIDSKNICFKCYFKYESMDTEPIKQWLDLGMPVRIHGFWSPGREYIVAQEVSVVVISTPDVVLEYP